MRDDWSRDEVEAIVGDYLDMLRKELAREEYSKTAHRERLPAGLRARSKGSIEFKHANISAVLVALGLPYIDGYRPRGNYQRLLEQGVIESYPRVRRYSHAGVDPELWFEDVILLAQFVSGSHAPEGVSVDADDDKYFAAAIEGGATSIVSGDPDLLTVKEFQGVRIVTPRVFLDLLSG